MTMMRSYVLGTLLLAATPAIAEPIERRLHSDDVDASSFLWNDWNKFVENYHPNYVADDDPKTAWVEGSKGSGAGEQLRIQLTPLDKTSSVRLRIRNGYQKSRALFAANARAKDVTLRLLPSGAELALTLADQDGWQNVTIAQPSGLVQAVELVVRSVYEGSKYPDLCISDVQVYATSETPDNPAFEKHKRVALLRWRAGRMAAARRFAGKKLDLPLYTAYAVTEQPTKLRSVDHGLASYLDAIATDPGFAEWKDVIAIGRTVAGKLGEMTRAQISPRSKASLLEVDGLDVPDLDDVAGEGWLDSGAVRLPMLAKVSTLFADQLRVLDIKDPLAIADFETTKRCKTPTTWVARSAHGKDGPATVQAIAVGHCGYVEGREGRWRAYAVELYVYDRTGRLALVVGPGHIEAYRWTTDAGKPMLAGGRSFLPFQNLIVEAKQRAPVAIR